MSYHWKSAYKTVCNADRERNEIESRGFHCWICHEEYYAHSNSRSIRFTFSRLKCRKTISCLTFFVCTE